MSEPVLRFDPGATQKLDEMREAGRFDRSELRISVDEEGGIYCVTSKYMPSTTRSRSSTRTPAAKATPSSTAMASPCSSTR